MMNEVLITKNSKPMQVPYHKQHQQVAHHVDEVTMVMVWLLYKIITNHSPLSK